MSGHRAHVDVRLAARAALPVLAILVPIVAVGAILAAAGNTLGYDYLIYDGAARRLMAGGPLYDLSFAAPGPNGLFDYPPTFILAIIPFAATLTPLAASLAWIAMLNVAFLVGVVILPVRRETRWAVILLAGLSWPYLYAVKLGQLGPLLFLLYAIAWRWADRPLGVGVSVALGTAAKLQPLLLFGWALVTRRFRAVAVGLGVLLAGVVVAAAVGAVAVFAWLRYPSTVAIVVTAVASVMVSPIVWAHYAVILLLPVALLLDRRQWWVAALPIATWLPVDAVYPVVFAIGLLAPLAVG
ncbi:MAG TPA: glycosyltransferase 87 family protein, partial [Candidatus Limnocylindrales bacterium]